MTEGKIPLALQALSAEGGELAAQFKHAVGQLARDLVRTRARGTGKLLQALQALRLMTAEPLAHGGDGGLEGSGGGLDAVLTGMSDQTEAIVKGILHATNHIEVSYGSRHSPPRIERPGRKGGGNDAPWKAWKTQKASFPLFPPRLEIRRRACRISTFPPPLRRVPLSSLRSAAALLSPQQGRHLSSPLLTQTLQTDRGDTMYLSNSTLQRRLTVGQVGLKMFKFATWTALIQGVLWTRKRPSYTESGCWQSRKNCCTRSPNLIRTGAKRTKKAPRTLPTRPQMLTRRNSSFTRATITVAFFSL